MPRDGDRARRAVEHVTGDVPEQDAADRAAVRGADHEEVRVLLVHDALEATGGVQVGERDDVPLRAGGLALGAHHARGLLAEHGVEPGVGPAGQVAAARVGVGQDEARAAGGGQGSGQGDRIAAALAAVDADDDRAEHAGSRCWGARD